MPRDRPGPYDVAIVGFGPTGAALANLLGLCGLRVVVLERERAIHCLPRAVHFDGEVMRIFQAIGVSERVARVSRINAGMRFIDPHGKLLLDWPRPQQVGPQGWHPSYRFHQPDLEAILRYRLSSVPNVDVVLGADVTAIAQDAELGSITYREGDRQHTLTARYVVGCDGARSLVRTYITSRAEDLGFHERWLVIDLCCAGSGRTWAISPSSTAIRRPRRPTSGDLGCGGAGRFSSPTCPTHRRWRPRTSGGAWRAG